MLFETSLVYIQALNSKTSQIFAAKILRELNKRRTFLKFKYPTARVRF